MPVSFEEKLGFGFGLFGFLTGNFPTLINYLNTFYSVSNTPDFSVTICTYNPMGSE